MTDPKKIIEFLNNRYIHSIFPSKEKTQALMGTGKKLRFYLGIDPTGPDIHLGHATNLFVLKMLGALGFETILLVGDFTAQTGDPSDKEATRKVLTPEAVRENMKSYLAQAHKVLEKGSFKVKYNSDWLGKLTFNEVRKIARQSTVQQMIGRDMFQKRLAENKPITLEEFLYPLMQGYDSVAMAVDGEVGGNDQTFNMLVGRDLVGTLLKKEKIVITTKLLEAPLTGKKIMNKSEGNIISLNDSAPAMFGKAMALADAMVKKVFELCTEKEQDWIDQRQAATSAGENPKNFKVELAHELVRLYHGEKAADQARAEFETVFAYGGVPANIQEHEIKKETTILTVVKQWFGLSMTEAKRLLEQGAVAVNNETVKDWQAPVKTGDVIRVGAHRFGRVK